MKILIRSKGKIPTEKTIQSKFEEVEYLAYWTIVCANCGESLIPRKSSRYETFKCSTCGEEMHRVQSVCPIPALKESLRNENLYSKEVEEYILKYYGQKSPSERRKFVQNLMNMPDSQSGWDVVSKTNMFRSKRDFCNDRWRSNKYLTSGSKGDKV